MPRKTGMPFVKVDYSYTDETAKCYVWNPATEKQSGEALEIKLSDLRDLTVFVDDVDKEINGLVVAALYGAVKLPQDRSSDNKDSPSQKLAAMRSYWEDVLLKGRFFKEREQTYRLTWRDIQAAIATFAKPSKDHPKGRKVDANAIVASFERMAGEVQGR